MAVPTAARAKVTAAMGLESRRDRDALGQKQMHTHLWGALASFGGVVMILVILGKIKRCHIEIEDVPGSGSPKPTYQLRSGSWLLETATGGGWAGL